MNELVDFIDFDKKSMMKYRHKLHKQLIVEANQWNGEFDDIVVENKSSNVKLGWLYQINCDECGLIRKKHGIIKTLDGYKIVCLNYWVVKNYKGEYYLVKPDIFKKDYELFYCYNDCKHKEYKKEVREVMYGVFTTTKNFYCNKYNSAITVHYETNNCIRLEKCYN